MFFSLLVSLELSTKQRFYVVVLYGVLSAEVRICLRGGQVIIVESEREREQGRQTWPAVNAPNHISINLKRWRLIWLWPICSTDCISGSYPGRWQDGDSFRISLPLCVCAFLCVCVSVTCGRANFVRERESVRVCESHGFHGFVYKQDSSVCWMTCLNVKCRCPQTSGSVLKIGVVTAHAQSLKEIYFSKPLMKSQQRDNRQFCNLRRTIISFRLALKCVIL